MRHRFKDRIVLPALGTAAGRVLVVLMALSMSLPFLWMLSTSLMSHEETHTYPTPLVPETPRFANYREAMELLPMGRFLFNSLVLSDDNPLKETSGTKNTGHQANLLI